MSRQFHVYDSATGLFTGAVVMTNQVDPDAAQKFAKGNAPVGHAVFEGAVDHVSQRIDIGALPTTKIIDYQPPQPTPDHEWNTDTKRWQVSAAIQERKAARDAALSSIASLEASQARPMRELVRDPTNAEARKRLDAIEAEVVGLRAALAT